MERQITLPFDFETFEPAFEHDAQAEPEVMATALRLALFYADELDVPARYRGKAQKKRRSKKETLIERRFQDNVGAWHDLIGHMLGRLDASLAWRFLECSPLVPRGSQPITGCDDFCAFMDYLIRRRDTESCGPDELGRLCSLLQSLQQAIEKDLSAASA